MLWTSTRRWPKSWRLSVRRWRRRRRSTRRRTWWRTGTALLRTLPTARRWKRRGWRRRRAAPRRRRRRRRAGGRRRRGWTRRCRRRTRSTRGNWPAAWRATPSCATWCPAPRPPPPRRTPAACAAARRPALRARRARSVPRCAAPARWARRPSGAWRTWRPTGCCPPQPTPARPASGPTSRRPATVAARRTPATLSPFLRPCPGRPRRTWCCASSSRCTWRRGS
mmetsp:Transcript_528/g.1245  ORF Transcript_528/g.1245 Transcript_528/m.1245 type:complete len:224 (+) Transcript_528:917-1588(+)